MGDLGSHSEHEYFSAGVQCPLPDISFIPSASSTHLVVVVFFPNHSSLMFQGLLTALTCKSMWQETEGRVSKELTYNLRVCLLVLLRWSKAILSLLPALDTVSPSKTSINYISLF